MTVIVFHPGAPKTATSTLQHLLQEKRAMLERRGIGVILPQDIRGSSFLAKYLAVYRGRPLADMAEASAAFFRPWRRFDMVICSEETFCHDFMPSRRFGLGGIDRAEEAARLLSLSGFPQTRIVLTIRPQRDLLVSTYAHFVHRHREQRSFHQWLRSEVDLERLLWRPAVEAFRQRFGASAVKVVSMKAPVAGGSGGGDAYFRAILDALGIPMPGVELAVDRVHNPSPSARAVGLCRALNQRIPEGDLVEGLNSILIRTFPVERHGRFSPRFDLPPGLGRLFAEDHASVLHP